MGSSTPAALRVPASPHPHRLLLLPFCLFHSHPGLNVQVLMAWRSFHVFISCYCSVWWSSFFWLLDFHFFLFIIKPMWGFILVFIVILWGRMTVFATQMSENWKYPVIFKTFSRACWECGIGMAAPRKSGSSRCRQQLLCWFIRLSCFLPCVLHVTPAEGFLAGFP